MSDSRDLTDEEVRRNRLDAEMMRRPHMWPMGDRLPVKRREATDRPRLGMIFADEPTMVVTFAGSTEVYETAEEIVEAGWVVD